MTRIKLIERIRRLVYGEQPQDNASITDNLVNEYINDGIGIVIKNHWIENIKLDGISYINNAFYSTFSDISITNSADVNIYQFSLPKTPYGIGKNEGIASIELKDNKGYLSYPLIPLSINQVGYERNLPKLPNKILYWNENSTIYVQSTLPLNLYKAKIRMISGSNSTSLDSELNVPDEWIGDIIKYVSTYLIAEKNMPQDITNDGRDNSTKQ